MKRILLSQAKFALIDDDDFDYISQFKWSYSNIGYAVRVKEKKPILMHRIINNTPDGMETDHKNQNTLDNRKVNLRTCTSSQNKRNRGRQKNNTTSKYKGVCWDRRRKKWHPQIVSRGKKYYIGRFTCEKQAARAYNKKALELFGEFACLNEVA